MIHVEKGNSTFIPRTGVRCSPVRSMSTGCCWMLCWWLCRFSSWGCQHQHHCLCDSEADQMIAHQVQEGTSESCCRCDSEAGQKGCLPGPGDYKGRQLLRWDSWAPPHPGTAPGCCPPRTSLQPAVLRRGTSSVPSAPPSCTTPSYTHSTKHSTNRSLTLSLTHSLTDSLTDSLTHSLTSFFPCLTPYTHSRQTCFVYVSTSCHMNK